jgi:hypothetical protein
MRVGGFLLGLFSACAIAGVLVYAGIISINPRWNPWAPIALADAPNFLTRYKLSRLAADPSSCQAALAQAPMRYTLLPDRQTGDGCGLRNAVRIEATSVAVDPFTLSCRSAVALALWERHVLQPSALRAFGVPATRIEHFGSYACRNVYGSAGDRRSQHATADALDVAGIVLKDGRRVRVRDGWRGDPAEGAFLRDLHAGACLFFDTVLGPDYNAAHHDHLHVDRGSFRICR